ncbi:DUF2313 domain-containing protein [Agrobacterium leguminum]|uniref:DUF2313 domain-containing protein n=2 Tax=Agrobacterium TaxID=357 RepID=A0A1S7TY90_9HYPH|nr:MULTISPECIES: putative phage tail protein [Agrobacterium]MCZ7909398.1 DUF2313 domain-containing protein [Agrobacterium leguminum]WFS67930.1 DUF2313 domain-containing protein [Agrobacterium leguminum]CVI59559.1 hypothetical protein AGR7A_Lc120591 [Agrobacterium deltaense NCPPB 1641]
MARDPGVNTRTTTASASAATDSTPFAWDNLSSPANDDLIGGAVSLWPPGAAFGTPDGQALSLSSLLARFTRVLVSPFEWLYARGYRLVSESTVFGVSEMLADWEAEYGLPDACGVGDDSVSGRIRALEAKLMAAAVITPSDFIRLAASYGFSIIIEEPAVFECGFSECGGEHTVGDVAQEVYWSVHIENLAVDYFTCGESECGYDPLFSLGASERLLCLLRQHAPAWTLPIPTLSGGADFILTYYDGDGNGFLVTFTDDDDEATILLAD